MNPSSSCWFPSRSLWFTRLSSTGRRPILTLVHSFFMISLDKMNLNSKEEVHLFQKKEFLRIIESDSIETQFDRPTPASTDSHAFTAWKSALIDSLPFSGR